MNKLRSILLHLIFAVLACTADSFALDKIDWKFFNEGLEKAAEQKKYVFLNFHADWCTYCHVLNNTTFKNPSVIEELNRNFISVRIDTESKEIISWKGEKISYNEFSAGMGVFSLPTFLFLDERCEIIGSYPYFADEEMMLNLLTYISSGSRQRNESFDEFLRRQNK